MRIIIKENDKRRMVFIVPLLPFTTRPLSKLVAKLLSKRSSGEKSEGAAVEEKNKPTQSAEDIRAFFRVLRNYAKSHRAFKLVEIFDGDGTQVLICL